MATKTKPLPTFDEQMGVMRHVIYRTCFGYHDFKTYTIVRDEVNGFKVEIIKDCSQPMRAVVHWRYDPKLPPTKLTFLIHEWQPGSMLCTIRYEGDEDFPGIEDKSVIFFKSGMEDYKDINDAALAMVQQANKIIGDVLRAALSK